MTNDFEVGFRSLIGTDLLKMVTLIFLININLSGHD